MLIVSLRYAKHIHFREYAFKYASANILSEHPGKVGIIEGPPEDGPEIRHVVEPRLS